MIHSGSKKRVTFLKVNLVTRIKTLILYSDLYLVYHEVLIIQSMKRRTVVGGITLHGFLVPLATLGDQNIDFMTKTKSKKKN